MAAGSSTRPAAVDSAADDHTESARSRAMPAEQSPRGDAAKGERTDAREDGDVDADADDHDGRATTAKRTKDQPKDKDADDADGDADGDDGDDADGDADADADADGDGEDDKHSSKKARRELPPHTVDILKSWMLSTEHFKHPYPTDEDKQMLLKKTGITMKQLTNWFTNARKRIWKPMMKREHSRQMQNVMDGERARVAGQYREGMFPQRQVVRQAFEVGPGMHAPRGPAMYAPQQQYEVAVGPHGYPVGPGGVAMYGPRSGRSFSDASVIHAMGEPDGGDATRGRKRALDVNAELANGTKRYRQAVVASPSAVKMLQDWVATHAYPMPTDADKLQLSRDTGLDVQQLESWFNAHVGRFAGANPGAMQPSPLQLQHQRRQELQMRQMLQQTQQMQGRPGFQGPPPARGSPMYPQPQPQPQPPAYGERPSVPFRGNPMFPPRSAAAAMPRASIPTDGNPQFPSGPGVRRAPPPFNPSYPAAPPPTGYDSATGHPMRQVPAPQAPQAAAPAIPPPVGAPSSSSSSVLPSLTNRNLAGPRAGPTMGQARDGRSHTLDMGQFADARRRTMNFQDILASTSANAGNPGNPAPPSAAASPPSRTSPTFAAAQQIAALAQHGARGAGIEPQAI